MRYIVVTNVDAKTKRPCTQSPMSSGPSFPELKGLVIEWAEEAEWPISCDAYGVYSSAPRYYGTCDFDADVTLDGVLEIISKQEYSIRKRAEHYSRKPFDSWVFDEATFSWNAPTSRPSDNEDYRWDEPSRAWIIPSHGGLS